MNTRLRAAKGRAPLRSRRQAGFALITGVFLITMLFLLSAYMIGFRVYQEASVSIDTLSTRAYAAARSGIEWGAFDSLRNGNCAALTPLALGGTLAGYTVTVTCVRTPGLNEGGVIIAMDTITATACNNAICNPAAPGPNYVERQITAVVGNP